MTYFEERSDEPARDQPKSRAAAARRAATMGSMGAALTLALVLSAVFAQVARADDESLVPAGKFGVLAGMRVNLDTLGELASPGIIIGTEAHFNPARPGQFLALGVAWSAIVGRFGLKDPSSADSPLRTMEMSGGLRLRHGLSDVRARFVVLSAGGTILRTSIPIETDGGRVHAGGYAGLGYEDYLFGRTVVSLEARYHYMPSGASQVGAVLGLGFSEGSNTGVSALSLLLTIGGAVLMQSL